MNNYLDETPSELAEKLKNNDRQVRSQAATKLGQYCAGVALNPLIEALNDEDDYVRLAALRSMGQIGNKDALIAVIRLFGDTSSQVRSVAAFVAGSLGDKATAEQLISLLKDQDSSVRFAVSAALSQIGSQSIEPLILLLTLDSQNIDARRAMHLMTDPECVDVLLSFLKDNNYKKREIAAEFLVQFANKTLVKDFEKALADSNEKVQHFAQIALDIISLD